MMNKILNLKNTNKFLYYVLFPVVIFVFMLKIMLDSNIMKAVKSLQNAQKTEDSLKKEQEKLQKESDKLSVEANEIGKKASVHEENANSLNVDENWHKE